MAAIGVDEFQVVLRDVGRFTDPLALRTDWQPASPEGAGMLNACFNPPADGRLRSTINPLSIFLFLLPVMFGLSYVIGWMELDTDWGRKMSSLFWLDGDLSDLILGFFLLLFGVVGLFDVSSPRVFDRHSGWYWRGWRQPQGRHRARIHDRAVRLQLIHAVQLLTKRRLNEEGKGLDIAHELNLVLEDATRINVFCHGNLAQLRSDAQRVSSFLSVPVWDAAHELG
jgi:hypothetical protein